MFSCTRFRKREALLDALAMADNLCVQIQLDERTCICLATVLHECMDAVLLSWLACFVMKSMTYFVLFALRCLLCVGIIVLLRCSRNICLLGHYCCMMWYQLHLLMLYALRCCCAIYISRFLS